MTTWPATLPPPALSSLRESPPNNVIRTSMDKGPDKVRRRTTANIRPLSFNMKLTPAQVETLDEFFTDTTFSGSIEFDYEHPRTGENVTARFVEPPQYSENSGAIYDCSVSLEIMP